MPAIPLFALTGNRTLGLNGIQQGQQFLLNELRLAQQARDDARDQIDFGAQLDQLDQFNAFRRQGLSPAQALFAQSQGSFNPISAQAGLNNFAANAATIAPFAIEAAQNGNPGLFNQTVGAAGIQFNPNNPLSGFSAFGAPGIAEQARAAQIQQVTGLPLVQPQPVLQAAPVPVGIPQFAGTVDPGLAAGQLGLVPQQQVQQQQVQQQQQQQDATQTAIQRNAEQIRNLAISSSQNSGVRNNNAVSNPQQQRQEAVTFPTSIPQATRIDDRQARNSFQGLFASIV